MSLFKYGHIDSKDEFRLISLRAGPSGSPLRGEIIVRSLADDVEYSAISYVWGSYQKPHSLATTNGTIPITESLNSALNCLRSTEHETVLWADAVCINQNDNVEKNRQVRRMREIFEKAKRVYAYLGKEADNSELAYDLLLKIGTTDLAKAYKIGARDVIGVQMVGNTQPTILPRSGDIAWKAIGALLCRAWYKRVWVVQEIAVAREVVIVCGKWKMDWSIFTNALTQSNAHSLLSFVNLGNSAMQFGLPDDGQESFLRLNWLRQAVKQRQRRLLLDLLVAFRPASSTMARDHLFALLGVATDAEDTVFDPDYVESLESVIRRYAGAFIRNGLGNRLLSEAGIASQPFRFPSWIPDWINRANPTYVLAIEDGHDVYDAAKGTTAVFRVNQDNSLLRVQSGIFDIIARVGRSEGHLGSEPTSFQDLDVIFDCLEEAESMVADITNYPSGEDITMALWRTWIGNRSTFDKKASHLFVELFPLAKELLRRVKTRDTGANEDALFTTARPYLWQLFKNLEHRRFCMTELGYIGLCPEKAQPGDAIHIIHGTRTPYVLRKCDDRSDHYRLVGQCYVHGIMNGEACASKDFIAKDIFLW